MSKNRLLIITFVFNFLFANSQSEKNSPNFIFILADDQGWNGTSVEMLKGEISSKSDFYETPNLEKLASRGIIFSNAYASAPVCAPSRYSIQFGQTPARLKMIRVGMNTSHIDHNMELTIPKQLKLINPNYLTAHFGKWGMDSDPSTIGYDFSDGPTKNKDGVFDYKSNKKQWSNTFDEDPKNIFSITKSSLKFIEKSISNNNPFFLQISHYAIHSDLVMRKKTFEKYNNKKPGDIHDNIGLASMTEDLDYSVGMILKKLKELGIENNTYIIYSSDNGSVPIITPRNNYNKSYNSPLKRGKWDAMEGGVRVPFIITGPKLKSNTYSNVQISFSDLLPTIVDLAGNKKLIDKKLDGGSFKNILFGKKSKINRNIDGLIFHVPYKNKIALDRPHSAIIIDNLKLIKFYDNNETRLYDLSNDLSESTDLSTKKIKLARKLENKLENYLSSVKAPKWKPGITWKNVSIYKINSFH